MANELIILLVMIVTLTMIIVGMAFNKLWGFKKNNFIDLRKKLSNIQERMNNAQMMGDIRQMRQIQLEANQLFKSLLSKQLLPLCARCILFLGVWVILDIFVFFNYRSGLLPFFIPLLGDGWVALYFLFALGFSLLIYAGKLLYRKLSGKEVKKTSFLKDLMKDLSLSSTSPLSGGSPLSIDTKNDHYSIQNYDKENFEDETNPPDTWKDKIHK